MREQEKRNKRVGAIVSGVVHALLLLAFLFIMAWKAPNPPAKSPGIEINFGTSDAGFGDEQPTVNQDATENSQPQQQEAPESQPTPPTESVAEQPVTKPVTEPATKAVVKAVTQPEPSPVADEKEVKPTPKPQPEVKEEPKKADQRQLFPGQKKDDKSKNDSNNPSQGDKAGATGDQGKEDGKVDARNLYGESGGGQGGTQLSIANWYWNDEPNKKDSSSETGRIVFEFDVNSEGYVGNIRTVSTTVSPTVVQFYKRQLEQTTFHRTAGGVVPDKTTGTVTFIIKAR